MEIKNNSFAEDSLSREKRALFFASEAVQLAREVTKQAKETTKQTELREKTRLKLARLGILPEGTTAQQQADSETNTTASPAENTANVAPSLVEGPTTKILIVQHIPRKQREKQDFLARQINNLLAGKGVKDKKTKKKNQMREAGEAILREIDPGYTRQNAGNFSLETQRVVAKVLTQIVPKETIEKAENGDAMAAGIVAAKIEGLYQILDHAKNRLHAKEIRKSTRRLLRPAFLRINNADSKEIRKGLKRRKKVNEIDELNHETFQIPTLPEKENKEKTDPAGEKGKTENDQSDSPEKNKKDEAWKPKGRLAKLAYYGPLGLPYLAHRAVLRPAKKILKFSGSQIVKPFKFIGKKIIAPPIKFLWDKTYKKGFWFGTGRAALWIVGSGVTGGWPIIPVAVESAIAIGRKIKNSPKAQAAAEETKYVAKNVANISTLGIPLAVGAVIKNVWSKIRLPRKNEKQKK